MSSPKAGFIVLIVKLAPKLLSLLGKLFKTLKGSKGVWAAASLGSYAYVFTWQFALLLVISLSIHEYGHVLAMKKVGVKTKGFYLIPFVGGAAIAEEAFPSRPAEVFIALAGPIFGIATATIPLMIYLVTGSPMWAAAAGWISMLNLFNMIPINPLDGGRVAKSIIFSLPININAWHVMFYIFFIGLPTAFFFSSGLFVLIFLIGIMDIMIEMNQSKQNSQDLLRNIGAPVSPRKPNLSKKEIYTSIWGYVGIVGILWAIMFIVQDVPGADIAVQFLKE